MAKILVVDDDPQIVDLVRFSLQTVGHEVLEAFDGQEALKKLGVEPPNEKAQLPELIILDVMMPVMDGLTAFKRIRAEPRTASIPIVILTAKSQTESFFTEVSADAFFHKPFSPGDLRTVIGSFLAKKKA